MTESNEPTKTEKLANKRIWISTLVGIIIPIGAYIYTWRWKPFLYLMGTCAALGFLVGVVTPNPEKAYKRSFRLGQVLGIVVAPIDNGTAISRARIETKGKSNED